MQDIFNHTGLLSINLKALADNYKAFQEKVGVGCAVAGVVKANAYGLGMAQVVETLNKLDCPQYFVATLDEAIALRKLNTTSPIAVLGGLFIGAEEAYLEHNLTPILNSLQDIERWKDLANKKEQVLNCIIHFDTGMNRLGLSRDETKALIGNKDLTQELNIKTVMTHFACADEKDHLLTKKQAHDFANIAQHFPDAQKSLANSPGLFRSERYHYDMVRPGYALYGGNPTPEVNNPMRAVVDLSVRILQIRLCKNGESIGYGASHTFQKDTKTATVALGYADGFLRSGSGSVNGGAVLYWNNQPCPILGRVSMDLVSIDISNITGQQPQAGDMVEVLGHNQSVDDLARAMGSIGYEVLTSLGRRYKRHYLYETL